MYLYFGQISEPAQPTHLSFVFWIQVMFHIDKLDGLRSDGNKFQVYY